MVLVIQNLSANAEDTTEVRDVGSVIRSGSLGGGNGNRLQYFCLKNSMDKRNLLGYSPMESQRVRHNWATEHVSSMFRNEARQKSAQCMTDSICIKLQKMEVNTDKWFPEAEEEQEGEITKEKRGSFGGWRICSLSWLWWWFHGVYIYQNLQIVHFKYVQFSICQYYLNKIVFKKEATPFLGIYPEKTLIPKNSCTLVFTAALFAIARTWKEPKRPSTEEWIKKTWHIRQWNITQP